MNLDDLKQDWKKEHDELAKDHFEGLDIEVVTQVIEFETAIVRRDMVEAAAGVAALILFGSFLWFAPGSFIITCGTVIIMLAVVEIVVVMFWTRHRDSQPRKDASLSEFCTAELTRVNRQIALLGGITWWYSGPFLLGVCVMMYGIMHELKRVAPELSTLVYYGFLAAFFACFLATGVIIYRGSRRIVNSDLAPIRDKLAELVRSLEESACDGS